MKKFLYYLSKTLIIAFSVLTFALFLITIFRPEWIKIAVEWTGKLIETLGYWNYVIAMISAFAESLPIIGAVVPGMNIMILVGGFWGKIHLVETIIFACIGAMLGNYIGYILGKKYGDSLIKNYGDWIGIGTTEQKILEKQIEKNGFWYIVLGKFHGTLRAFIPFIAGASKMTEKNFWLYNSIGSVIWAISMNLIGYFFIEHYEVILDNIGKIITGLLIVILAYFFFFKRDSLKKYWDDKNAEMLAKYPQNPNIKPGKMKEKIWETQYKNLSIRVENAWSWSGFTKEKIFINNEVFHKYSGKIKGANGLTKDFYTENHKITIKIGANWNMLNTACQILVDDEFIF